MIFIKCIKAHPLQFFSYLHPLFWAAAIPLLGDTRKAFAAGQVSERFFLEAAAVSLFLFLAVARLKGFELVLSENKIFIKSGVFIKEEKIIPINKISLISRHKGVIARLFGSQKVRIETEAAENKKEISFRLRKRDALWLFSTLCETGEVKRRTRVPFLKTVIGAAAVSSVVVGALLSAPVINRAGKLLGTAVSQIFSAAANGINELLGGLVPSVVNSLTALFLIFYLISFLITLFKNLFTEILDSGYAFEIRAGFPFRRMVRFKTRAINSVTLWQPFILRFFGKWLEKVSVAGGGKRREKIILPIMDKIEAREKTTLLSGGKQNKTLKVKRGTLYRFLRWKLTSLYGVFVVFRVAALLFPQFSQFIVFLLCIAVAVLLYSLTLAAYDYKNGEAVFSQDFLFAHAVKGLSIAKTFIKKDRVGVIKLVRFPSDRKKDTCSIKIIERSRAAESIKVRQVCFCKAKEYITSFWQE